MIMPVFGTMITGKIENEEITYHDTREIFENGKVVSFTGSPRTLLEQQNQKLRYKLLKEKIVKKEPLSIELIKEYTKFSPEEPTMNAGISPMRNVRGSLKGTIM